VLRDRVMAAQKFYYAYRSYQQVGPLDHTAHNAAARRKQR